jgi:hypothetical protein
MNNLHSNMSSHLQTLYYGRDRKLKHCEDAANYFLRSFCHYLVAALVMKKTTNHVHVVRRVGPLSHLDRKTYFADLCSIHI